MKINLTSLIAVTQGIHYVSSAFTTTTTTTINRGFISITKNTIPSSTSTTSSSSSTSTSTTSLTMALTPVGPFCPFRSKAAIEMEPRMENLNNAGPEFATEMARLQLDMQVGQTPDPNRLKTVANGINSAVDEWELLITRLSISNDFQTLEYGKLTQAHLASHDQSTSEIAIMMRWQASCMIAMAENTSPPFPPPGIDMMKMMEDAKKNAAAAADGGQAPPNMTQMASAEKITSTPFTGDEPAFQEENIRAEYEKLCRDHNDLINLGGSYTTFDPMGKIAYLDQMDNIEERWDVFYTRFSLLGQLNQVFVEQCNMFLTSMGLNEGEFRKLLKETHFIMRQDAERERGLIA